jgi:hypothetical protein
MPSLSERLKALVECNCDFKERTDDSALPAGFVRHANWCNTMKHGGPETLQAAAVCAAVEAFQAAEQARIKARDAWVVENSEQQHQQFISANAHYEVVKIRLLEMDLG